MKDIAQMIAGHAARNRELVALIARRGGDLEVVRTVDLHFWAYDETQANGLAEELREFGLKNVFARLSAKDKSVWNVEGQIIRSVREVVEPGLVEQFAKLAAAHQADFDGWGTSL